MSSGSPGRVAIAIICWAFVLPIPAAFAACPNADTQPDQISVGDYATTLLCLMNQTRADRGRDDLQLQGNLIRSANRMAADMVELKFFAHDSPDLGSFADRLDSAGFIPSDDLHWSAGENLAAGSYAYGSPSSIMGAWMQSPDHRVNVLDDGFTMVGIGVARGWPGYGNYSDAMTIAVDFGYRRKPRRHSG